MKKESREHFIRRIKLSLEIGVYLDPDAVIDEDDIMPRERASNEEA